MKIVSYNINGIRAVLKKGFDDWLKALDADVICLQEIKANEEQFDFEIFEKLGYQAHIHPAEKKGYSGLAILTRIKTSHIEIGCGIEQYDVEGRVIRADFENFSVMSIYMPSGASKEERQLFKLQWLKDFQTYINELKGRIPNLIICGDFNICHQAIDIHDPVRNKNISGFLPEERAWLSALLESGFTDSFRQVNTAPDQYSWWSYRANSRANNKGWRLDYALVSKPLDTQILNAQILSAAVHSDHCPVTVEISL